MYTYNFSKRLSKILNIKFTKDILLSDQELDKIPEDAITNPQKIYSNLGTLAAAQINTGKKRPEHSKLMKQYYQEGKINPPILGRYKSGHKFSEQTLQKISKNGSAARLGKKRKPYTILNRKIEICKCGKTISGAANIRKHNAKCQQDKTLLREH